MKERALTSVGAAAALLAFYVLFFQKTPQTPITRPQSTETGRNGYAAIASWLEDGGVPVATLRRRFESLSGPDASYAPRGNLLITTMPHLIPARANEVEALHAWIAHGNTLLVLAALDDTPEWTVPSASFLQQLAAVTGLTFTAAGAEAEGSAAGPENTRARPPEPFGPPPVAAGSEIVLRPTGEHPLLAGVESLHAVSDAPSALWIERPAGADPLVVRLAAERETGLDALWERAEGSGRIIVCASGSLLTNHVVARSDAGVFLGNLVRYELAPGGTVIFDDMHQGLSVLYDPAAFFRDSRLHATLLFLGAAWLAYVLGSSNRLGAPAVPETAPRQRDFLEAVGGFMARRLDRRDAGLLMFEEWFDEIRKRRGLPRRGGPPWESLSATPTLSRETVAVLERAYARLEDGRGVDLMWLHNLINKARKAIG